MDKNWWFYCEATFNQVLCEKIIFETQFLNLETIRNQNLILKTVLFLNVKVQFKQHLTFYY